MRLLLSLGTRNRGYNPLKPPKLPAYPGSFAVCTRPLIYPPAMVSSVHAQQNVRVEKLFSENLFRCKIWWFIPHAPKRLGKHRGIWGDDILKIAGSESL